MVRCRIGLLTSCSLDAPGVVRHHFGNGLIVGEPSGEATPRVKKLVELLQATGIETTLSPQIQRDVWFKLWGNMTVNPISALTGATTDLIMGDDYVRGFISAVMLEAKEIGRRIGIEIAQSFLPPREADWHDVLADGVGIALGLLAAWPITRMSLTD